MNKERRKAIHTFAAKLSEHTQKMARFQRICGRWRLKRSELDAYLDAARN